MSWVRRRKLLPAIFCLLAIASVPLAPPAHAIGTAKADAEEASVRSTPEQVDAALQRVRDRGMQWELPVTEEDSFRFPSMGSSLPLMEILMYLGAAVLLGLLAMLVVSWLRNLTPPTVNDAEDIVPPPVQLSTRPLDSAREAALRGDYAEAIHLILLGTIEEIRSSIGFDAPPWLTSREIARLAPLPAAATPPLERLVVAVEECHFGLSTAGEAEFRACVTAHNELRDACRGRSSRGR